ncbi:MAG TPA: dual specificity protein phosphatase family protein [Bacillota bacterium]|nr:dual specificity protein phosphatase family protein [Bacillota bacterium]
MDRVKYNALVPAKIYIGSENDAQDMVDVAGCQVIIDLRDESDKPAFSSQAAKWIHIGLKDHITGQEEQIKKAVDTVVNVYKEGKVIGIHCASGVCRTGTVACGVLIELGICKKIKEALEYVEISRNKTSLHPNLKKTLQNLYR